MSSNDLVRYITEQMVSYLDRPKSERKEIRTQKKSTRPPFSNRWFGLLPMALAFFFRGLLKK
ncbi:MAG TPA: YqzE family protein [Bacillales bacterium]|nr:YqzE family protein [Bacillales bacterium]